jgi:archaellum component FlaC
MGWEAAGVIIALVALIVTFVSAIIKLNNTITRLTVVVDNLANDYNGFLKKSHESHLNIHNRINEVDKRVDNHETRLTRIEIKEGIEHGDI